MTGLFIVAMTIAAEAAGHARHNSNSEGAPKPEHKGICLEKPASKKGDKIGDAMFMFIVLLPGLVLAGILTMFLFFMMKVFFMTHGVKFH